MINKLRLFLYFYIFIFLYFYIYQSKIIDYIDIGIVLIKINNISNYTMTHIGNYDVILFI